MIAFDAPLAGGTLTLVQGEVVIDSNVFIDGDIDGDDAPDITIDGAGASAVIHVYSGTVTLNGLTIRAVTLRTAPASAVGDVLRLTTRPTSPLPIRSSATTSPTMAAAFPSLPAARCSWSIPKCRATRPTTAAAASPMPAR